MTRPLTPGSALSTLRTVGAILPADLLAAVITGTDLDGLGADDYHLELGLTPREAANRAWSVLTGAWTGYRLALDDRAPNDPSVSLTREKWLRVLLRELGFGRVPATPAGGLVADGRSWPVSHCAADVPVHLLGWRTDLDHRTPGMAGAAERSPHAMIQELLNRSDRYLWALLANGNTLRLLRDSSAFVGPSYVEFDLEAMFDGEVFSDFVVLYLLCHQSRFEPTDPDIGMTSCWLEQWRTHAAEVGTRALGALRIGVRHAIEALGTGLLTHPANASLRAEVDDGRLELADLQRALLRIVYRLLFCFVAEDRDLLLDPDADPAARARYIEWFATARLRYIAARRHGDNHDDLWQALSLVLDGLGNEAGCPQIGLPGLGGIFELGPADVATGCQLSNRHLLAAIRHLCVVTPPGGGPRRMVDYRHLGAEELGSIYESLLEYTPRHDAAARTLTLESLAGNDRKKTGAYYTPTSLTESLLDTALEPLLGRALRQPDPEAALLALTVCDPACGSGHFLVAAGRRIAARLATIRADRADPSVDDLHQAMHEVVARCLYGVDLNPMAVELTKVSLWLEGMRAGAPLSLLDAHIKVGNALLGTTPALLAAGIPDDAFAPVEGDDRRTVTALKRRNRREQAGQDSILSASGITVDTAMLGAQLAAIEALPARHLGDINAAAQRLRGLDASRELRLARLLADAWCAAFVLPKNPGRPELTHGYLLRLQRTPANRRNQVDQQLVEAVTAAQQRYQFLHWHIEFPQIFTVATDGTANSVTGWAGGFDCVIGNPPWERVKLQEQEWFAARHPVIAEAPNAAARKRLIAALESQHPQLHAAFLADKRQAEGESHLIRSSGRYPLCGRGDINTYSIFAETDRSLLAPTGRLGVILPTGIATDATTQYFFKDLVTAKSLVSLYDFENALPLFEGVHRSFKFCLLTLSGTSAPVDAASFAFFVHHPSDLARPGVRFNLTPEELALLNPNTGTCPVFRSRRDAEITLGIYRRHPVLIRKGDPNGNPWGVSFMRMMDMSNDAGLFHTRAQLQSEGWILKGNTFRRSGKIMLPLYEAKMIHHFDHRWATFNDSGDTRDMTEAEHIDSELTVVPRYWVDESEVKTRLEGRWDHDWLFGFRNITNTTNERTLVCGSLPLAAVGNSLPLLLASHLPVLLASITSSLAADFVVRQKLGGTNLNFFYLEQLPTPDPKIFSELCPWDSRRLLQDWIEDRLDELIFTADDMAPAALSLGDDGSPFIWDPDRRAVLRAELDAGFFHLYGIEGADVDYILGTFPIVNRNDVKRYGEQRTHRLVLEAYDSMAKAIDTGRDFESPLDPPAGEGARHPEPDISVKRALADGPRGTDMAPAA